MPELKLIKPQLSRVIRRTGAVRLRGRVTAVVGPTIRAVLNGVAVGDLVKIRERGQLGEDSEEARWLYAQVVAFNGRQSILSAYGNVHNIIPGAEVESNGRPHQLTVGPFLQGAVVDGLGRIVRPSPALGVDSSMELVDFYNHPPSSLERQPITKPLITGVRSIDSFVPVGLGQRLAIFAEPGVGKSTLLSSIASRSDADVTVIALIGERGREVGQLVDEALSTEVKARTVVVASTSAEPAIMRANAAECATRIAEHFREQGKNVLLLLDSLTRLFRAYREIGLAAGETPVRRGYPPSVFEKLPGLLERAGTSAKGSITGLYTVLLSSDLDEDPMVEEVKGLTDGHMMLKRRIAEQGIYPAVDVIESCSRLSQRLLSPEMAKAAADVRAAIVQLQQEKEAALLGSLRNDRFEQVRALDKQLFEFLSQKDQGSRSLDTQSALLGLAEDARIFLAG